MPEFRTKGKGSDRTVYPVRKRKPYGISRELAYSDVEAMRAKGDRARLIRTNRKLDLYAPFISTIPGENASQTAPGATVIGAANPGASVSSGLVNAARKQLDELMHSQRLRRAFVNRTGQESEISEYQSGGDTFLNVVNQDHTMMVFEKLHNLTEKANPEDKTNSYARVPKLSKLMDANEDHLSVEIPEPFVKSLLKFFSHYGTVKGEKDSYGDISVMVGMNRGSHKAHIMLIDTDNSDGAEYNAKKILGDYAFTVASSRLSGEQMQSFFSPSLFYQSLKAASDLSPSTELKIQTSDDYPMSVTNNGYSADATKGSLIAPKMEDRRAPFMKILRESDGE